MQTKGVDEVQHPIEVETGFVGQFREGVGWYVYPTTRFKTITLQAFWINELDPNTAALGALLPHVLKRGTVSWPDSVAIEKQLESLYGASFRADVGKIGDKQLISISLEVIHGQYLPGEPDTLHAGLGFLDEVLNRPRVDHADQFDPEYVSQEKELLRRQIHALINDKGQYAMQRLIETMADGRPFGLRKVGQPKDVERATPQSLFAYYDQVRHQSPFVLLAVGDVEPETIAAYVDQHWAGPRTTLQSIVPYAPHHQDYEVVDRQPVQQGKVNLGYWTRRTLTSRDYPALMMYAGVLGGFAHSKLFVNVREKASLAYYAYARLDAALGFMVVGAGIEFQDYQAVKDIIAEQLDAMRRGDITDQEMTFTRQAFQNDILSEEDLPHQLIGRQMEKLLLGGGLTGETLITALEAVTVPDIQRVAEDILLDTVFFLTTDGSAGRETTHTDE